MARKKLLHFEDMHAWDHCFGPEDDPKDQWGSPLAVELACGRGYYTLALARLHPDWTLVGVDIKGARMWHGAEEAQREGLHNVNFLRTRIEDLANFFNPKSIHDLWITFPDPHQREGKAKKRLSSPRFLSIYRELLADGGRLHLKTDSKLLFDYSLETLEEEGWTLERVIRDVYAPDVEDELLHVKTQYEKKHLKEGKTIQYLCAVA